MPRVTVQVNVLSCEQKQEGVRTAAHGDFMESTLNVEIAVDGHTFPVPVKQTQGDTFKVSSGQSLD